MYTTICVQPHLQRPKEHNGQAAHNADLEEVVMLLEKHTWNIILVYVEDKIPCCCLRLVKELIVPACHMWYLFFKAGSKVLVEQEAV